MNPTLQIKDRLSILDVVSTYIRVEKSGNQYKARCPFHNEKTPSFYISPARGSYHCFGCSKGGDIFSFIEEIEHIPFREALKLLADKAGVELSNLKNENTDKSLFEILESAVVFYQDVLKKHSEVTLYVRERGIFPETIEMFNIGYAPNEWRKLYEHLKKNGYTDNGIEKSGLCVKTEKGYYDRFRGRVMFPIYNPSGKPVGFTGRILPTVEKTLDKPTAKYVNTPETELYHKSKILFGYNLAKKDIANKDICIVVEGQMDVIMAHQAGSTNTIAVSGTAFTSDQVGLIKRLTSKVVLCFDTDNAGLAALKRSASLALLEEIDVYVIELGDAKDPAELILKDSSQWHTLVENKVSVIDFLLNHYKGENLSDREYGQRISKEVLPILACMVDKIDQAHFISVIAKKLNTSTETVESSMKTLGTSSIQEESKKDLNDIAVVKHDKLLEHLVGLVHLQSEDAKLIYFERIKLIEDISESQSFGIDDIPLEMINQYVIEAEALYVDISKHTEEIEALLSRFSEIKLESKVFSIQRSLGQSQSGEKEDLLYRELEVTSKELDIIRKRRHTHK